jgi:hypothetical protein
MQENSAQSRAIETGISSAAQAVRIPGTAVDPGKLRHASGGAQPVAGGGLVRMLRRGGLKAEAAPGRAGSTTGKGQFTPPAGVALRDVKLARTSLDTQQGQRAEGQPTGPAPRRHTARRTTTEVDSLMVDGEERPLRPSMPADIRNGSHRIINYLLSQLRAHRQDEFCGKMMRRTICDFELYRQRYS